MSLQELAEIFNWIELSYIFATPDADLEEEELLAEVVAEAWRGGLLKLFPDRKFAVEILPEEKTGDGLGVEFKKVTG